LYVQFSRSNGVHGDLFFVAAKTELCLRLDSIRRGEGYDPVDQRNRRGASLDAFGRPCCMLSRAVPFSRPPLHLGAKWCIRLE
jgi:hypothetical protein